jgi:predicted cupin superfamily sugar epimerase
LAFLFWQQFDIAHNRFKRHFEKIGSRSKFRRRRAVPNYDKVKLLVAVSLNEKKSYSLVGCTVSQGFHYKDWKIGIRKVLIEKFPQHKDTIEKFTKSS